MNNKPTYEVFERFTNFTCEVCEVLKYLVCGFIMQKGTFFVVLKLISPFLNIEGVTCFRYDFYLQIYKRDRISRYSVTSKI